MNSPIQVHWREDGSCLLLARITAHDATGEWTEVDGEGNWIKQADLAAQGTGITCKVFDVGPNAATPDTAITTPTITIADVVLDTPVTDRKLWTQDHVGYNLKVPLAGTNFPTGGNVYRVELSFQSSGGTAWTDAWEGVAKGRRSG